MTPMSGSTATRSTPRRWGTCLTAGLLTLVLGPLLLEFHSTPQAHSALDSAVEIFTEAAHPTQPAHFDAAASEERERCAYCILKIQSAGSFQPAPALVSLVSAPLGASRFEAVRPSSSCCTPASPRAPPAAVAA